MARKIKIIVDRTGMEGFFERTRAHADALDLGLPLPDEDVIAFEDPIDMFRMMTPERIRLMDSLRETKESRITDLAVRLGRNKRAVSRDVAAMQHHGLVKTRYITNAGHGRNLVVSRSAKRVELKSTL